MQLLAEVERHRREGLAPRTRRTRTTGRSTSSLGVSEVAFATVKSRRPSQPAFAASVPPVAWRSGHSMFDWPEATHTSPDHTSSRVIVFDVPAIVIVNGPPAGRAGRSTLHLPSAPAVARAGGPPARATVTPSPGAAQPHTRAGTSRWRTMC